MRVHRLRKLKNTHFCNHDKQTTSTIAAIFNLCKSWPFPLHSLKIEVSLLEQSYTFGCWTVSWIATHQEFVVIQKSIKKLSWSFLCFKVADWPSKNPLIFIVIFHCPIHKATTSHEDKIASPILTLYFQELCTLKCSPPRLKFIMLFFFFPPEVSIHSISCFLSWLSWMSNMKRKTTFLHYNKNTK